MATHAVRSIAELKSVIGSGISELKAILNVLATIDSSVQKRLDDGEEEPTYVITQNQMGDLQGILRYALQPMADLLGGPTITVDTDYFTYPYSWQAGVDGNLSSFVITATTITAKTEEPIADTTLTDVFDEIQTGDYVKISNAEDAANDGVWLVNGTPTLGVLTLTGTLITTSQPDTQMKIELFHKKHA